MKKLLFILIAVLVFPISSMASEVQHVLQGLEQLIFIGVAALVVVLIPIFVYLNIRKKSIASFLFIAGGITAFAGLLLTSSRGDEISGFGRILLFVGAINIIVPLVKKPTR